MERFRMQRELLHMNVSRTEVKEEIRLQMEAEVS